MLWLQAPPWGKWILAGLISLTAIWVEFRPAPLVEVPFASRPIAPGETIGRENTDSRPAPSGLIVAGSLGDVATTAIGAGDPILASSTGDPITQVPPGWWVLDLELPGGAHRGMPAIVVLLTTGRVVDAVVALERDADPLGASTGAVALRPEDAAEVATAAADGLTVVLIETP